jgi:hypothetical protein
VDSDSAWLCPGIRDRLSDPDQIRPGQVLQIPQPSNTERHENTRIMKEKS